MSLCVFSSYLLERIVNFLSLVKHSHVLCAFDLKHVLNPSILDHPELKLQRNCKVLSANNKGTRNRPISLLGEILLLRQVSYKE